MKQLFDQFNFDSVSGFLKFPKVSKICKEKNSTTEVLSGKIILIPTTKIVDGDPCEDPDFLTGAVFDGFLRRFGERPGVGIRRDPDGDGAHRIGIVRRVNLGNVRARGHRMCGGSSRARGHFASPARARVLTVRFPGECSGGIRIPLPSVPAGAHRSPPEPLDPEDV